MVYQVKRYAQKLSSRQKADVQESLQRLMTDQRWADLTVGVWRLVTPWDPSPAAEQWLQSLDGPWLRPGVRKVWHGLTWADQQAAKYDDVVDYYLHGGRARVEKAYEEVMALLRSQSSTAGLSVGEVQSQIQAALQVRDCPKSGVTDLA
ncbi:hypothetical protein [Micropruina sonneratiae]|uniref:hypothetical protein n=1 Tax=Micropruina sonneratiae TaxID=2986940 RepID=UPI0022279FA5|nr:hypothetical protein [Micropruina sp. KQZ13P-5]MCW3159651.1 hypothetical protein [Micropruina sp. KQZ13P-5]